jgi:signal transduction histidine kinase
VPDRPPVDSPGVALRLHPARLLLTSWPWRSLAYVAATPVVASLWLVTCWPLLILAGLPLGHVERWRLRWIDRRATPNPHAPGTARGFKSRARLRAGERSTWTELLHGVLLLPLSLLNLALASVTLLMPVMMVAASAALFVLLVLGVDPGSVTTVTDLPSSAFDDDPAAQVGFAALGVILFAAGMYVVTLAAEGQRYLCRALVSEPSAQLRPRLDDVRRSRARITSAFDEERRRIERDLHDGAQQRLTSLVMTLGTMKYQLHRGIDISPLVDQASADAQQAVDELRDIVRGIYPSALREHDLAEALDDLASRAERAGLAADIDLAIPPDLPADIEVGLYFAVSELVTNVTKHSGATTLTLHAALTRQETLLVTVEDDGHGGASPGSGTGLVGVIDRIETLGGRVAFSSPVGGPTRMSVEVPCASS